VPRGERGRGRGGRGTRAAASRRSTPEDVDAEELQERHRNGNPCPEDEAPEQDREIGASPHEERDGNREQAVLDELKEADEVVVEERVV
jgi:hypothetical protein